jgi:succinate dehydrogenase / fumarate reductase iron-sulfur subunit
MKERVVDRRYDPVVALGRKILRRDQLEGTAVNAPGVPIVHSVPVTVAEGAAPVNFGRELAPPMTMAVDDHGKMNLNETLADRSAAPSPFGDDINFPIDPKGLNYYHPKKD